MRPGSKLLLKTKVTVLPLALLSSLLFAGLGLLVSARAKSIDEISYPQYLIIFPMFLFCGVFYPIESLPAALQWVAWALPLTAVLSLVRTLTRPSSWILRGAAERIHSCNSANFGSG